MKIGRTSAHLIKSRNNFDYDRLAKIYQDFIELISFILKPQKDVRLITLKNSVFMAQHLQSANLATFSISFQYNLQMAQKRQWTEEEDRLLKFVFQSSKLSKWSHIARKLQEDFGVKGRNGKQCRERYVTQIDTSFAREQWSPQEQQMMIEYHNQLGNKWAIIGSKLNGKSDNCVKNHFYALLRQALRKINKIVNSQHKKELKQFKATILYKIVEVSEKRFKLFSQYEKTFMDFSNELKKELIDFSYNDGIGEEEDINYEVGIQIIGKLTDFHSSYKKKLKKDRKNSGQGKDLLTPNRYQQKFKKIHSQNQDSDNASFVNSSETSNLEDISDDQVHRINNKGKGRRNSANSLTEPHQMIMTRTRSSGNLLQQKGGKFKEKVDYKMDCEDNENEQVRKKESVHDISKGLGIEGILDGMKILQEEDHFPYLVMVTKSSSRYSKTSNPMQKEQYHFFEDSQIEMRILPELQIKLRQDSQVENFFG